jgi:ribonuclease Z
VHEVFDHARDPVPRGTQSAETMPQVASYHTLSTEVGGIAREAGAGALILTHIVPPTTDPARLVEQARAGFDGFVAVGEDLMTIDVAGRQIGWRGLSVGF